MGWKYLMDLPWEVEAQHVLVELATGVILEEIGTDTIRARPNEWMLRAWRTTYNFLNSSHGLDWTRRGMELRGRLVLPPSEKDGYWFQDCQNAFERRMLQFLVPIFNPDGGCSPRVAHRGW